MQPIYKPEFSVENKNKILSESDIKTVVVVRFDGSENTPR